MKNTLIKTACISAATIASAEGVYAGSSTPHSDSRPNILIIISDELFADARSSAIGNKYINTPNIDSLVAEGMTFTRAYSPDPICMPTRCSLITGHFPHETNIVTNGGKVNTKLNAKPLPLLFKEAGYATGYVGKWHIQPALASPKQFDFSAFIRHQGIDRRIVPPILDFIKKQDNKPFLAVCSFANPHNICEWPREGEGGKYKDGDVGKLPSDDQLPPIRENAGIPENECDAIVKMRELYQKTKKFPVANYDEIKWRQYIWAYYRMTELVDGHIGELLKGLEEAGHKKDTLVVFMSDHGDCMGAHGWNQKTVFYDESSRVMFTFRYPGVIPAGTTSDVLVNTGTDLIPTLCDFAGIPIPKSLPGLSLKGILTGKEKSLGRKYVVSENHFTNKSCPEIEGERMANGRMVRSDRYKYCIYDMGKKRESLVDMKNDPGEMKNVAGEKEYAPVLKQHRKYYLEFRKKYNDNAFELPDGYGDDLDN